jgi:hypothetical protein
MKYTTVSDAINAAKELNQAKGYAQAFAVMNEDHDIIVIRAHNLNQWLNNHPQRVLLGW